MATTRPLVDSDAFDAAFGGFVSDDLEMLKSELASMAAMQTPMPQVHSMTPLAPLTPSQRRMSFSELPLISELASPLPQFRGNTAHGGNTAHSVDLSMDIMQSFYGSPDSSSSPEGADSGNASDTSATFSGSGGSPTQQLVYDGEEEEGDVFSSMGIDLEEGEDGESRPFSKARPFAKKSRATFLAELTPEERALLREEGVHIPADGSTLTKTEERQVKKVRRKIKNKMSAQESRKKKKEYVDGLEARVEQCTRVNVGLHTKIGALESSNRTLLQQLQDLQAQVQKMASSGGTSASTCLMLLGLCFSVYLNPAGGIPGSGGASATSEFAPSSFSSRTLKSMPVSLDVGGASSAETMAWFNTFFKAGNAASDSDYVVDTSPVSSTVTEMASDEEEEEFADSNTRKRKAAPTSEDEELAAANVSSRSARLSARVVRRNRLQPVA